MAIQRYHIEYAPSAIDDLRSLPKREADQILRKVLRLENGLHGNIKRLRMGDYRVLFDVIGDKILVQKVGNRKDVYE